MIYCKIKKSKLEKFKYDADKRSKGGYRQYMSGILKNAAHMRNRPDLQSDVDSLSDVEVEVVFNMYLSHLVKQTFS